MSSVVTGDALQGFMSWYNRGRLPPGVPIPWTGVRKRRKRHGRGKGNMLSVRAYEVAPSRYCCHGHDFVSPNKGSQRRKERVQWREEWQMEQQEELDELMAYGSFE